MKIEIDLNDILGDENGVETLQESVWRQCIETLTRDIQSGVTKRINDETTRILNDELQKAVVERMPTIVEDVMTTEYTPVDRYGSRERRSTTFRAEIIAAIADQMIYKPARYDSDKTVFTKAVDAAVAEKLAQFKADYNKAVDAQFTAAALEYAAQKLREKLGIKA